MPHWWSERGAETSQWTGICIILPPHGKGHTIHLNLSRWRKLQYYGALQFIPLGSQGTTVLRALWIFLQLQFQTQHLSKILGTVFGGPAPYAVDENEAPAKSTILARCLARWLFTHMLLSHCVYSVLAKRSIDFWPVQAEARGISHTNDGCIPLRLSYFPITCVSPTCAKGNALCNPSSGTRGGEINLFIYYYFCWLGSNK